MSEYLEPNKAQIRCFADGDLPLPIRSSPVRFAIRDKDGAVSSSWKVTVKRTGDVYIFPRDIMEGTKISLHASGQQHVVLNRPNHNKMKWNEPPRESPVKASVKLLFTAWSVGTGPTRRFDAAKLEKVLTKNQIFVERDDCEDIVIAYCFLLTPPGVNLDMPPWPPMGEVAVLPVGEEKELHIVARREHRPNSREALEAMLNEDANSPAASKPRQIGHRSLQLIGGDDVDGRPFLAPVSVEMKPGGLKLIRSRRAFVNVPKEVSATASPNQVELRTDDRPS